jgi:hypothetical protein
MTTKPDNVAQLLRPIYAPRVVLGPELAELQRVITGQGLPTTQSKTGGFLNEGAARAQGIWMMAVEWACKEAGRQLATVDADAGRWRAWCEFTAAQDEPARLAMEAVIGPVLDAGQEPTKEVLDRAIDAAIATRSPA